MAEKTWFTCEPLQETVVANVRSAGRIGSNVAASSAPYPPQPAGSVADSTLPIVVEQLLQPGCAALIFPSTYQTLT
jgi:hypothetical protein